MVWLKAVAAAVTFGVTLAALMAGLAYVIPRAVPPMETQPKHVSSG